MLSQLPPTTPDATPVATAARGGDAVPPDNTRPSTANRLRDVLLPDEFAGTSARDAYGLVQQYRPVWLRVRGATSFQDQTEGQVQVYVNGTRWGDVERLRGIPIVDIQELRYRSGAEATMRYGANHAGGVIEVSTR